MPRIKRIHTQDSFNLPFPTRLRQLIEDSGQTQEFIAKQIEVNRQSIGQWKDGTTAPDVYTLVKIANHFGVSADYLLGLTNVQSNKTDIKSVHEKTGLLDMAIENLISENVSQIGNTSILSELLSKEHFYKLLYDIHNLVNAKIKKLLYEKTIEENPSLQTWLKLKEEQRKEKIEDVYMVTLNPSDFYVFRENKLKEAFIGIAREFIDSTLESIDINDFADDKQPTFSDYEVYLKERKLKK